MPTLRSVHIQYFKGLSDVLLPDCGPINVIVGRNNSGKSSILHAIDMAGLALSTRDWGAFQLKLDLKDLFSEAGPFTVELEYYDGSKTTVRQHREGVGPTFQPPPTEEQRFGSMLVLPEGEAGLLRRRHLTPLQVMQYVQSRNFGQISGLDILFALQYYGQRQERGFSREDYQRIIHDVREFFPDLTMLEADRTEQDIATVTYEEYGRTLDILYAGAGLKHFLDILIKTAFSQAGVVLLDEPEMGMHPDLQRKFVGHLGRLADEKGLQFFIATHSPVFLVPSDSVSLYRAINTGSRREVRPVAKEATYTLWGDLGMRPSDLLQNDIVLFVEGQSDVIFLEHVVNTLYGDDLKEVSVGVVQYAGDAALGIIGGTIKVANIGSAQGYCLWTRDKDSEVGDPPSSASTKFAEALEQAGQRCHIWKKRSIEFYFPESLVIEAQQGNEDREAAVRAALGGNQEKKFKDLLPEGCRVPRGNYLRELLRKHLSTREDLDPEVRAVIEDTLLPWAREIRGG